MLLNSASQGDILTVIRRLDEHWIEARLGDKVGVCPLQFTEVSYPVKSCFFFPPRPVACGSDASPGFSLQKGFLIGLKVSPLCCAELELRADLCSAAASAAARCAWDCASLGFAGLTVVFRCTFCLRELTSATAGRNLTVASIWVNVSPLSAPVYLIN